MLIGFAVEAAGEGAPADAEVLQALGCERILSPAQGVFAFDDVVDYLRPGDVLAVADLSRLGKSLEQLVEALERLARAGVGVHVAGSDIVPGTALGDSFAKAGAILAAFWRQRSAEVSATGRARTRGRPPSLPPEARNRAERLLREGRTSVAEIARILGVSMATLYRYFPRRTWQPSLPAKANHAKAKTRRAPRERERPDSPKR